MQVNSIRLEQFRNYDTLETEFDSGVNVITGDNAQGKTNLLEAVSFLTCGRSFRAKTDRELIRFGQSQTAVTAGISSGDREQKLEVRFGAGIRKQAFANGVKLKSLSELAGRLTAVLFLPDHLYMVRQGASSRRKLLDESLCQLRPAYASALAEYGRCYEEKTRILRDRETKPSLLEMLDEYNARMVQLSALLIRYRARLVSALETEAGKIHREFSGGEELRLIYRTVKTVTDPFASTQQIAQELAEHQRAHRQAELESGLCLSGAHKDDLEILIDEKSAKEFASQGQARTAALSLKLAQRELFEKDRGEYPVLLLDDVLSELDSVRQGFVLNRIRSGQIFITCCDGGRTAELMGGRVFTVREGRLV